MMDPNQ